MRVDRADVEKTNRSNLGMMRVRPIRQRVETMVVRPPSRFPHLIASVEFQRVGLS